MNLARFLQVLTDTANEVGEDNVMDFEVKLRLRQEDEDFFEEVDAQELDGELIELIPEDVSVMIGSKQFQITVNIDNIGKD